MDQNDVHAGIRDDMARQQAEDAARQTAEANRRAAEREAIERPIREAAAARAAGGGGTNALARIRRKAGQTNPLATMQPSTGGLISNQMAGTSYGSNPYARSNYR